MLPSYLMDQKLAALEQALPGLVASYGEDGLCDAFTELADEIVKSAAEYDHAYVRVRLVPMFEVACPRRHPAPA